MVGGGGRGRPTAAGVIRSGKTAIILECVQPEFCSPSPSASSRPPRSSMPRNRPTPLRKRGTLSTTTSAPRCRIRIDGWRISTQSRSPTGWPRRTPSPSAYLDQLPLRDDLKKRITELWDYPKVGMPFIEAGRVFYRKNSGLQKQSPLFVRTGAGRIADARDRSESSSGRTATRRWRARAPSPDASLLAYMMSEGGADWQTVHVRDLSTRQGPDRPDQVDALLRTVVDERLEGFLLFALSRSRPPARCSKPRCRARRSTTTASARRSPTIG